MLAVTRSVNESVVINGEERVEVIAITKDSARLKITYPKSGEEETNCDLRLYGEPVSLRCRRSTIQLLTVFKEPDRPKVRLGFDVPANVTIFRGELVD